MVVPFTEEHDELRYAVFLGRCFSVQVVCCVDSRDRPRARSMWSRESVGENA